MGGHVNMMDDVLISNLPPELLRSAMRVLVSQGSVTQKPFVNHIRERFTDTPPKLAAPEDLFPSVNHVSLQCSRYMALTRCLFSCKLAAESLRYLIHFIESIQLGGARWESDSDLEAVLEKFGGDVVQAVQALKESKPEPTEALEDQLLKLWTALKDCQTYCENTKPEPLIYPLTRAERQVKDVIGFLFPNGTSLSLLIDTLSSQILVDLSKQGDTEMFALGPYQVPRLFNGLWQLSSPAWGSGTAEKQAAALKHLVEYGLTSTDMADHYGDAELIYGEFRNRLAPDVREQVYAATKWCVFGPINQPVTNDFVLSAVKERCRRLGGRVELLQFHWYDYEEKEYLEILAELVNITRTHSGLVSTIGLCNFDSKHTKEVCEYLLAKQGAVGIVSNQIQFSLFDSRPLQQMCTVCTEYGLKLLTYGSFCGGFLSQKWFNQPVPEIYAENNQLTPSQRKYFDMIGNWGTWAEFQALLGVLLSTADKYGVSLTNVATRWVLQQPAVGAVIVGTRLGVSAHGDENLKVFDFTLNDDDMESINNAALGGGGEKSLTIFQKLGDCGNEYRAMH
ncbi:aldo/keto reductase [Truncatella angustata]|uniref:Aldo/keto reductase n=1 Tax=Truncatella angustata TaxID=152316 RepID=A0A9P8RHT6_9PEZI|nr:aldo/keto reductase [Truncatella angustata]KAH6646278.1 aldo/keto reductase [Truncatella angustata]